MLLLSSAAAATGVQANQASRLTARRESEAMATDRPSSAGESWRPRAMA